MRTSSRRSTGKMRRTHPSRGWSTTARKSAHQGLFACAVRKVKGGWRSDAGHSTARRRACYDASHRQASSSKRNTRLPSRKSGIFSRHHAAASEFASASRSTARLAFTMYPVTFTVRPVRYHHNQPKRVRGPASESPARYVRGLRGLAVGRRNPIQASRTHSGAGPIGRLVITTNMSRASHLGPLSATGRRGCRLRTRRNVSTVAVTRDSCCTVVRGVDRTTQYGRRL